MNESCNSENIYIVPMEYGNDVDRVYIGISTGNWKQSLYN